jgi:predicted metal-dependent peptidase
VIDPPKDADPAALELIRRACTRIVLDFPLIGMTLLGAAIRIRPSEDSAMYHTDGVSIFYRESYVRTQTPADVVFDLIHEWLHIFGRDGDRRQGRRLSLWRYAVDIYVVAEAMRLTNRSSPSADSIFPPHWSRGLSKEQIYDRLLEEQTNKKKDKEEPGKGAPGSASPDDSIPHTCDLNFAPPDPDFVRRLRDDTATGLVAESRRRSPDASRTLYGQGIISRLQRLMSDPIPWERLVIGRLQGLVGAEYSTWSPPNLRYYEHDVVLPRTRSRQTDRMVIGVDVSASMSDDQLGRAISCVIGAAQRAQEVIVVTFDQSIREVVRTRDPESVLRSVRFLMGEHMFTDARPVFELIELERPSAAVIFTDGGIALPDRCSVDTLFVMVPNSLTAMPFGDVFVMEDSW